MEIEDDFFRCAICGVSEGDSSNLTTQSSLQTNATVGCGHQLYVYTNPFILKYLFQSYLLFLSSIIQLYVLC